MKLKAIKNCYLDTENFVMLLHLLTRRKEGRVLLYL